ncbi:enoyl-CoA hydratase, partial [Xanthomonas perforans]
MQDTGLIVEDHGAVRTLRLHRPAVHNAFDATLIAALTDALREAGRASQIRVVVLTGDGAAFSAGADLNWMRGMASASEAE